MCVFSEATCGREVPTGNEEKVDCLSKAVIVQVKEVVLLLLLCSKVLSDTLHVHICLLLICLMHRAISCAIIRKLCDLSERMLWVAFSDLWHRGERGEASATSSSLTVTTSQQNSLKPGLPLPTISCPSVPKLASRAHLEEGRRFSFVFVFISSCGLTCFSLLCCCRCVVWHRSLHKHQLAFLQLTRLHVIEKQEWALHCEITHLMLTERTKHTGNCFALRAFDNHLQQQSEWETSSRRNVGLLSAQCMQLICLQITLNSYPQPTPLCY